jgi:uncharacterized protein
MPAQKNVLGRPLEPCSKSPVTGFFRNGNCETCPEDIGVHVVCAQLTREFLEFSKSQGNDLTRPNAMAGFPGLKPRDRWCLCALRWKEALDAGVAPPVILDSTHESALDVVPFEDLKRMALFDF